MIAYRTCSVPQLIPTTGITLGITGVEPPRPAMIFLPERQAVRRIQYAVAAHYGVRWFDMVSDRRARSIAWPRQVAMYLCRELTPHSLPRIGKHFGGRDHTTVIHAIKAVEARKAENPLLRRDIAELLHRLSTDEPPSHVPITMRKSLEYGKEQGVNGQVETMAA